MHAREPLHGSLASSEPQVWVLSPLFNQLAISRPPPRPGFRTEQTDGRGRDHPEDKGDYSDFRDDEIDLRGTVIADAMGRFEVMSVFPKEYWPRPPHIHYWIRAEGYRPLVTQHYLDTRPGNRPHRTARVDRSQTPAVYPAPTFYVEPV